MKITITYIKLKSPLFIFRLSSHAMKIMRQLKASEFKAFKKRGFWTKHYTMTLWKTEEELKEFASSGAHLEAMKASPTIAKEIKTITMDATTLPDWTTAKKHLEHAKLLKF